MLRLFPYFLQQFWRAFSTWYQVREAATFMIFWPIVPVLQQPQFSSLFLFQEESGKNTLKLSKNRFKVSPGLRTFQYPYQQFPV